MKSFLARLFRGEDGLPDRALVSVTFHTKGTLFEPYERRITERGPASNEVMEADYWKVLAPEARATELGEAALDAFGRIRTVTGPKQGMWGRPGYSDDVRAALGLKPRAALWSAAGKVTLSVRDDRLVVRPMRPEGAAGGFVFLKDHGLPDIAQSDLTPDRLGAVLVEARAIVRARR